MDAGDQQVSAMLPAHARIKETLATLERLHACEPAPAEILVHVASSQTATRKAIKEGFPGVRLLLSEENLGPGGARNRMLCEARNEFVASFDDDSYPEQPTFFRDLAHTFVRLPEASILALNIREPSDRRFCDMSPPRETASFVGCGCAYRRSHFVEGKGYVPIPIAYSMEEADLALRYAARQRKIFFAPHLQIYHNTTLGHHATARVAGMQVANTALFAYLRYPVSRWPLGFGQYCLKWLDTLRRGRFRGALVSFPLTLYQLWRYRSFRETVPADILDRYRSFLRTNPLNEGE